MIEITQDKVQRFITIRETDNKDLHREEARAVILQRLREETGMVPYWHITDFESVNYNEMVVTLER